MSDLNYNINANVTGEEDVKGLADDIERIGDDTTLTVDATGVTETAEGLESISTSTADEKLGDVGAAAEGAGGLANTAAGAFNDMVNAVGLVTIASYGADFVMGKLGERLDYIKATEAWEAGRVTAYADALAEVVDNVEAIEEVVRALGDAPIQQTTGLLGFGGGSELPNITASLGQLGITYEEVRAVIEGGQPELDAFNQRLENIGQDGSFGAQVMGILAHEQEAYGTALAISGHEADFFAETQGSANRALQEMLNEQDPMRQFTSEWDLLKESMSDGSIDTTAAANALNTLSEGLNLTTEEVLELAQADLDEAAQGALAFADALNSIEFDSTDLQGATTAFAAYTDQLFAAGNEAERREAAFDALSAAAEGQTLTFSAATEAGRAQSDALEGVARVIDEDLARAYDEANGSQEAFVAAATQIGEDTLVRLQNELGLSAAQVDTLRNVLGLTEGDYEARFALAGAEEARLQLDLLSGAITGLPDDLEVIVTQQILAGDFVAARDTVAAYYAENPVPLSTEVDTADVTATGIAALAAALVSDPVTITPEVDTGPAVEEIEGVADAEYTAVINTEAETGDAAAELDQVADESRTAVIETDARTGDAAAELSRVTNQRRTAVINAVLGDYPSNSQIAARIGTVRVPIVAYWTTRVEGNRPR